MPTLGPKSINIAYIGLFGSPKPFRWNGLPGSPGTRDCRAQGVGFVVLWVYRAQGITTRGPSPSEAWLHRLKVGLRGYTYCFLVENKGTCITWGLYTGIISPYSLLRTSKYRVKPSPAV